MDKRTAKYWKSEIKKHFEMIRKHYNNDRTTMNYFKKHLAWYMKNLNNANELRKQAVSVKSIDEMIKIIDNLPEHF